MSGTFAGFEAHAMPCESCGRLVRIESTDERSTAEMWSSGTLAVYCHDCGLPNEDALA